MDNSKGSFGGGNVSEQQLMDQVATLMPRSEAEAAVASLESELKSSIPDLTPYAKKTDIPASPDLTGFITNQSLSLALNSALASYAKKTDLPDTSSLISSTALNTALAAYAKSSDLSGYVTTSALTTALSNAGISVSRLTATLGSDGSVTVAHGRSSAPVIVPIARFVSDRGYWAVVGAITATQVKLTGERSKGTLLLSAGPNEPATSGDMVEVLVLGR